MREPYHARRSESASLLVIARWLEAIGLHERAAALRAEAARLIVAN